MWVYRLLAGKAASPTRPAQFVAAGAYARWSSRNTRRRLSTWRQMASNFALLEPNACKAWAFISDPLMTSSAGIIGEQRSIFVQVGGNQSGRKNLVRRKAGSSSGPCKLYFIFGRNEKLTQHVVAQKQ